MSYGFDLSGLTLNRFRKQIEEGYLIPSMRRLREGISENFSLIESRGIVLVSELGNRISNQKKADDFAVAIGIDAEYMTALRRLISSYKAKPRKLSEFPDIDPPLLQILESEGLKTSNKLYEYLEAVDSRVVLNLTGLSSTGLNTLRSLMEVTQLRYVSPLFATAMVRSGYGSISLVAGAEKVQFLNSLKQTNKNLNIYKGNIGDSDIQFLIEDAVFYLELQK